MALNELTKEIHDNAVSRGTRRTCAGENRPK